MLIGYARVSKLDQNPKLQIDALEAAGCEKVFVEKASGAQRDRPQLKAALDYLRPSDALVVWKIDRLARSLKQTIETIETLHERNIEFISITEKIDTTSASGKLMFHIISAFAEMERTLIRERTMAGLAQARALGRRGGRKPKLSAQDMAAAKTLLANDSFTAKQVAEQFEISISTLYRLFPAAKSS